MVREKKGARTQAAARWGRLEVVRGKQQQLLTVRRDQLKISKVG